MTPSSDTMSREDIENMIDARVSQQLTAYDRELQQPRHKENQDAIVSIRISITRMVGIFIGINCMVGLGVALAEHFWK